MTDEPDRETELREQIEAIYIRKRDEAEAETKELVEELAGIIATQPIAMFIMSGVCQCEECQLERRVCEMNADEGSDRIQ